MSSAPWHAAIVLGLPGTGKSTMCRALAPMPNLVHSGAGDILRELKPETPAGRKAGPYMHRGELVPDDLMLEVWREHTHRQVKLGRFTPDQQTLLLDGIPRTLDQARGIEGDVDVRAVLFLDVDDDGVLVRRLLSRGKESGRSDDRSELVIRRRIADHREQVLPVLEAYPEAIRRRVDAGRHALPVLADVADALARSLL